MENYVHGNRESAMNFRQRKFAYYFKRSPVPALAVGIPTSEASSGPFTIEENLSRYEL